MAYIVILVVISYLMLILVSIYFYINNRNNKKLIYQTEETYKQKIDELNSKLTKIQEIQNKLPDLVTEFDKLSVQISSELTEFSSPILAKFTEIKSDIGELNEFFNDKSNDAINALTEDKEEINGLKEQIIKLQSDIINISSYFSNSNEIQEKINLLEKQINQLSDEIHQSFKEEFLQIQQEFNSVKSDVNGFRFDSLNIKNMDSNLFEMNKSIVKVQRDIMVLKEKLKKEEKDKFIELTEMINPNDIVIDEDNVKEQVQTIIDYTVTPKVKVNSKKIIDMIDNGEIEIK